MTTTTKTPTKPCTNPRLEDDGFCTQCGKVHRTSQPKRQAVVVNGKKIELPKQPARKHLPKAQPLTTDPDEILAAEINSEMSNTLWLPGL